MWRSRGDDRFILGCGHCESEAMNKESGVSSSMKRIVRVQQTLFPLDRDEGRK
jgi:hypothetical protein